MSVALALGAGVAALHAAPAVCLGQIVRGDKDARLNMANNPKFEATVAVHFPSVGGAGSGVLVAPNMVVTNAHVAEEFRSSHGKVFVPFPASFDNPDRSSWKYYEVESVLVNPKYAQDKLSDVFKTDPNVRFANDIAVLILKKPVDIIQPATPAPSTYNPVGDEVAFAGFGHVKQGTIGPFLNPLDKSDNIFERGAGTNVIDAVGGQGGNVFHSDADSGWWRNDTGSAVPTANEALLVLANSGGGMFNDKDEIVAIHSGSRPEVKIKFNIPFIDTEFEIQRFAGQNFGTRVTQERIDELLASGDNITPLPSRASLLQDLLNPIFTPPGATAPSSGPSSVVDEVFGDLQSQAARMAAGLGSHRQTVEGAAPASEYADPYSARDPLDRPGELLDELFGDLLHQQSPGHDPRPGDGAQKGKKNKKDKENADEQPGQEVDPQPGGELPSEPAAPLTPPASQVTTAPAGPPAPTQPPAPREKPADRAAPKEITITPDISACLNILSESRKIINQGEVKYQNPRWSPDDFNTPQWLYRKLTPTEKGDMLVKAYGFASTCYSLVLKDAHSKAAELQKQGISATVKAPPFPTLDEYLGGYNPAKSKPK